MVAKSLMSLTDPITVIIKEVSVFNKPKELCSFYAVLKNAALEQTTFFSLIDGGKLANSIN